jgi:HEAT repeat protein
MGTLFRNILGIASVVTLIVLCLCINGTASEVSADSRLEEFRTTLASDDVEAAWKAIRAIPRELSGPEQEEIIHLLRKALVGQWPRCTGDIRQAIAQKLADFDAKAAVPDLLQLIREDRRISHECAE